MKKMYVLGLMLYVNSWIYAQPIDRKAVVERHIIKLNAVDTLGSLSVGNGKFAYTCDITGMQSFPEVYERGVPLGTQSDWGWHRFSNPANIRREQALKGFAIDGREVGYLVQGKEDAAKQAVEYFRVNPHRLQLGQIGMELTKVDGSTARISDIRIIEQSLNPWTGIILSSFILEGDTVFVQTAAHQKEDVIGFDVQSTLIAKGRLRIRIRFPYPNGQFKDVGNFLGSSDKHQSLLSGKDGRWIIDRWLDSTYYQVAITTNVEGSMEEREPHHYLLEPSSSKGQKRFSISVGFGSRQAGTVPAERVFNHSLMHWKKFWLSGGAVDFSGSTDKRASELERRVIHSQYLTKIQCTSPNPPQETGLTYNSWYGKPHIEMHWWHAVHFGQWGRPALMEPSLNWYFRVRHVARAIAKRQGYKGLRWQKMTDNEGAETPSSVGAFLIWQQPHFIFLAEQLFQQDPTVKRLNAYKELVFETADFIADFPQFDTIQNVYNLGKGLIPAQECFDPMDTYNPTYELAYWSWGLQKAQEWRERAGLLRNPEWDEVIEKLAPLPIKDSVYLASASTPDCYTNPRYLSDHPAVLGAYGMLPLVHGLDTAVMARTFAMVYNRWNWDKTWGWDYPMMAMTAARLGNGSMAVDALLMPVRTNTYLVNGHNYQDGRLTIYLPGNGGLLSAVALMCTGNAPGNRNAGFPNDGSWNVKWEGLKTMF